MQKKTQNINADNIKKYPQYIDDYISCSIQVILKTRRLANLPTETSRSYT